MNRVFLALWPDETTRQQCVKLSKRLHATNIRRVKPGNVHVTLAFIGAVDDTTLTLINRQVANISASPFRVVFDQLSFWRKPKILCLSCTNPPAGILQLEQVIYKRVSACGVTLDTREYQPHVTLARCAYTKPELDSAPITWQANAFCLVESVAATDGHDYQVLKSYPFF